MSLESKIKSKFKGVFVESVSGDVDSIEITFVKSRGSIIVTRTSEEYYSASYP